MIGSRSKDPKGEMHRTKALRNVTKAECNQLIIQPERWNYPSDSNAFSRITQTGRRRRRVDRRRYLPGTTPPTQHVSAISAPSGTYY